jgi:hypothetical protein
MDSERESFLGEVQGQITRHSLEFSIIMRIVRAWYSERDCGIAVFRVVEEFEFAWYCSIGIVILRLDSDCEEVNDVVSWLKKMPRRWHLSLLL